MVNPIFSWLPTVAWLGAVIMIFAWTTARNATSSGLALAYIFSITIIHWFGGTAMLIPGWHPTAPDIVHAGFILATFGCIAFVAGTFIGGKLGRNVSVDMSQDVRSPYYIGRAYVTIGLLSNFLLPGITKGVPTMQAVLASGWYLTAVGLSILCHVTWTAHEYRSFLKWLAVAFVLPLATIIAFGFIGSGVALLIIVLAVISRTVRPRWKVVVFGLLIGYLGISTFTSYIDHRMEIRRSVWGNQPLTSRISTLYRVAARPEWFDPTNSRHLQFLDDRLNQNRLVGHSVAWIGAGAVTYAQGDTFSDAALALIPRVIWPDKHFVAGGSALVSTYTGLSFARGTSVGIGQTMEFFINFGVVGVGVGFFLIGIFLGGLDVVAGLKLHQGDWLGFAKYLLPGIAFLQVEGSLVEIAASAGSALLTVTMINFWLAKSNTRRLVSGSRSPRFAKTFSST